MKDRDITVLLKILQYIDEINGTVSRFNLNLDKLKSDYVAKNAIAMCILQVGELVGKLTDDFRATYNNLPWRDIVGMRNIAAHAYGSFDMEMLWTTVTDRIPELKSYCEEIIEENEK
jgi:uncharacterized protein with HEPN domain